MSLVERLLKQATDRSQIADPERRAKPRLREEFRGTVERVDGNGQALQQDCLIQNISASGLYLRGDEKFVQDDQIKVVVELFIEGQTGSTVETLGRVVRIESQPDGKHGMAVEINRHRFL